MFVAAASAKPTSNSSLTLSPPTNPACTAHKRTTSCPCPPPCHDLHRGLQAPPRRKPSPALARQPGRGHTDRYSQRPDEVCGPSRSSKCATAPRARRRHCVVRRMEMIRQHHLRNHQIPRRTGIGDASSPSKSKTSYADPPRARPRHARLHPRPADVARVEAELTPLGSERIVDRPPSRTSSAWTCAGSTSTAEENVPRGYAPSRLHLSWMPSKPCPRTSVCRSCGPPPYRSHRRRRPPPNSCRNLARRPKPSASSAGN